MNLSQAKEIAFAEKWSGDPRVNMATIISAARVLARRVIELENETNQLECKSCYEVFNKRSDKPTSVVCQNCVPNFNNIEDYRCPNCGWDSTLDDTQSCLIRHENIRYNLYTAIMYGGFPHDWTEVWKCPHCETIFEYENGS